MTCDERIEKTLNWAGQTISDLPKATEYTFAHSIDNPEVFGNVMKLVSDFNRLQGEEYYRKNFNAVRVLADYILHLTDIIDRFEWALENTCNERDYLRRVMCGLCSNFHEDGADACETCMIGEGVPEYRSVDDE